MELKTLYKHFQSHPEGKWIMVWENSQRLYNLIKENNIHKVLDLGTGIGCTAAVMALAFQDKGETDWHIDSVEQYDKCIDLAKQLIPEEMQKNIAFIKQEPEAIQIEQIPCQYFSVYKELPEGDYDLILNDGPSPFMMGDKYVDLPNGTIHQLTAENKIKAGTKIAYDGRRQSFNLLERYFSANYQLILIPPAGQDFYVIEKKEGEIKINDDLLDAIKTQTNYFKGHEKNEKDIISLHQQSASGEATASVE